MKRAQAVLVVMAHHPGNARVAHAEQPVRVVFPFANTQGKPQTITFADIADQPLGTESIALQATSDSGLPVEFCVIAGPTRVDGNRLVFTKVPPRTKLPVPVTVAAYQWGRSIEPLAQSAPIVEQSFRVTR